MKSLLKILFLTAIIAGFWSCKKDENKIFFEGGTEPVLSSSITGSIPLSFTNSGSQAIKLNWTNPNYNFTTGLSSQNVNYILEIDTVGANFTNPNKQSLSISSNLEKTFTQGEFNNYLLGLGLKTGVPHQIEMRVISTLANNNARLISNSMKFTVVPFAIPPKVEKYSDKLFIVGNATPGDWTNPVPANQEFTKVSETLYTININLNANNSYLFLPVNGSWAQKYGFDGANNTNDPISGDFKKEGGDFKAPAVGGLYKIEVNFQTGKYKLTKI
jgi:starch-binding outer membrane protein SusE/F